MSHVDYFGTPLKVGDVALSAKAGGKFFDTTYIFVVIVETTPKLVRVHQIPDTKPDIPTEALIESLQTRRGRRAGRVNPRCLIHTGRSVSLTQQEMLNAIKKDNNSSPLLAPLFI